MNKIMETENLTKVYGDRIVVDNVDFSIRGGEIFGLFGPNGSGKSTILRMLTGITRPSKGAIRIQVNGSAINVISDPVMVREHASILTESPALYENMEMYSYLRFYGRFGRIKEDELSKRVLEAVAIVGMEDHLYRKLRQMSMGERQRIEIARVLLKNSPILFLDEPFNGIDITTRREIRDYLKNNWLNDNRCVFFTSHNLLESEHFVDRFAFIYQGRIIATGGEEELKKQFSTKKFVIHFRNKPCSRDAFSLMVSEGLIQEGEVITNRVFFTLSSHDELDEIIQVLVRNGHSFQEIHPVGTIEDIFIRMLDDKKQKEGKEDVDPYVNTAKASVEEIADHTADEERASEGDGPTDIDELEVNGSDEPRDVDELGASEGDEPRDIDELGASGSDEPRDVDELGAKGKDGPRDVDELEAKGSDETKNVDEPTNIDGTGDVNEPGEGPEREGGA